MHTRKLFSLGLAIILPLLNATAANAQTAKAGAKIPASVDQTNGAVAVPEPPSLALILAGALTFVGWSVLRRRAEP